MERRNRSAGYQHLYAETICTNEMMESFSNEDSILNKLNPFAYNEELLDLEDELKKEFWRLVKDCLTPRQKEVIKYLSDGYTQMEIAKFLNVNQSSITKSLNGNVDYKKGKKIYGGSRKKIDKLLETDNKIKEILDKMQALREKRF